MEDQEHFFELKQVLAELPENSSEMLLDERMVDKEAASCRIVRMYRKLPLHFHRCSDENVYVFRGRAIFQLGAEKKEISEGMFIHFPKGTQHAVLEILEEPLVTLTVDTHAGGRRHDVC